MSSRRTRSAMRWFLGSTLGGVVWPLGLSAIVLGVSTSGLSIGNLIGHGELLLLGGVLTIQAVAVLWDGESAFRGDPIVRIISIWAGVTLAMAVLVVWATRLAAVLESPNLLDKGQPWYVTWLGVADLVVANLLGLGAVLATSER